jgi:nicotinamide riboside transporter PnuC
MGDKTPCVQGVMIYTQFMRNFTEFLFVLLDVILIIILYILEDCNTPSVMSSVKCQYYTTITVHGVCLYRNSLWSVFYMCTVRPDISASGKIVRITEM